MTKKQFADFKKWCKYYIDFWGLTDWDCNFDAEDLHGDIAQLQTRTHQKSCRILLNNVMDISKYDMKETALHEVNHLLVEEIVYLGTCRCLDENEIPHANEALTNKLTNKLLPLI